MIANITKQKINKMCKVTAVFLNSRLWGLNWTNGKQTIAASSGENTDCRDLILQPPTPHPHPPSSQIAISANFRIFEIDMCIILQRGKEIPKLFMTCADFLNSFKCNRQSLLKFKPLVFL